MEGVNYQIDRENVEIKESNIPNGGYGLFAKKAFKKGAYVCSYEGVVRSQAYARDATSSNGAYLMEQMFLVGDESVKKIVDGMDMNSSLARFMNDPIDPKLVNVHEDIDDSTRTLVEHVENGPWGIIIMVAKKPIRAGDELYLDYGSDYWKEFSRTSLLTMDQIHELRHRDKTYETWFLKHFRYDDVSEQYYFASGRERRKPIEIDIDD